MLRATPSRAVAAAIAMADPNDPHNVPSELSAYAARLIANKNCKQYKMNRTFPIRVTRLFIALAPRILSTFPRTRLPPDKRYIPRRLQSRWVENMAIVHSGKWSDWVNQEVCNPTHKYTG
jgi:hypothetical protein